MALRRHRERPHLESHIEVEKHLRGLPRMIPFGIPEAYIGGGQSKLKFLGLKVPQIRKALKHPFSFSDLPKGEAIEIWTQIFFATDIYEVMSMPLGWVEGLRKKQSILEFWPELRKWSARVDNWAHADDLSKTYAVIIEEAPGRVLPTLKIWNRSRKPWLRRLSVVSLICYAGLRKKVLPFGTLMSFVLPLLDDPDRYVQKGVGWTLREIGTVYPDQTWEFLKKNIKRIRPAAFQATTERLTVARKREIKGRRALIPKKIGLAKMSQI